MKKDLIRRMWIERPFTTCEAFKNMKQVTRPVEDHPTSLNVTKAAAHKERWREKKYKCVFIMMLVLIEKHVKCVMI